MDWWRSEEQKADFPVRQNGHPGGLESYLLSAARVIQSPVSSCEMVPAESHQTACAVAGVWSFSCGHCPSIAVGDSHRGACSPVCRAATRYLSRSWLNREQKFVAVIDYLPLSCALFLPSAPVIFVRCQVLGTIQMSPFRERAHLSRTASASHTFFF